MNYSKNEELEFIKNLYDEADKRFKEIYKEQQNNRDALLKELGLILLTYKILNGFMNIKKADRNKESNKFYAMIANFAKNQIKLTTTALYEVTNNVVKNTYGFYSYNAKAKDIKKIVDFAYEGKHFSKRVWNNEKEIAEYMNEQIKNFIDGKINVNKIKKLIEETYNNNAYEVKRLVDTEISRCSNNAFDKFCIETGVRKVRYNATLDSRLCMDCLQYNDKVFDFNDRIELPRHPLCRCFYTIEDDFKTSGALSGALTSKNDPDFKRRDKHAKQYYESVRGRNSKKEILTIAKNTGLNPKTIEKVYNHVFINKYDLDQGYGNFCPDYDMAQSWQRLREGKNIQEHDLIMLKHERLEYELMSRYNKKYTEAHRLTEKKYNYAKALIEYLKENNLG
ncbi:hypothetical protein [Clostridium botulinum]|uniref:hypothetical protein n=1 Tax=Clostridium botulinum TaxID=1491 RepID=UPI0021BF1D94|nr:hypothetical protein [Clostridium botulinum]